jgi:hypothetical protein
MFGFEINFDGSDCLIVAAEIEKAVEADCSNRKFPPMPITRSLIMWNRLDILPDAVRQNLADFLGGQHRGKRGEKADADATRQDDIARVGLYMDFLKTMDRTQTLEKICEREKLKDIRSVERSLRRGFEYMEADAMDSERRIEIMQLEIALLEQQQRGREQLKKFIKDGA